MNDVGMGPAKGRPVPTHLDTADSQQGPYLFSQATRGNDNTIFMEIEGEFPNALPNGCESLRRAVLSTSQPAFHRIIPTALTDLP